LFVIMGAALMMLAIFSSLLLGALATFIGHSGDADAAVGATVLGLTGAAAAVFFGLLSLPSLIAGWGLLKPRRWARILGIIVAALSLMHFPWGTAFGIYALWVLLSKQTEPLFDQPAQRTT
jgi:hypothetical protein